MEGTATPTVATTDATTDTTAPSEGNLPFKYKIGYKKSRSYSSNRRSSSFIRMPDSTKGVCLTIETGIESIKGRRKTQEDQYKVVDGMLLKNESPPPRHDTLPIDIVAPTTSNNNNNNTTTNNNNSTSTPDGSPVGSPNRKLSKKRIMRPRGVPALPFGFYAVYDGHGGDKASAYVCSHLHVLFLDEANRLPEPISSEKQWEQCLYNAFMRVEEDWMKYADEIENCSGTTAAVAVIKDLLMVIGNVGDSEIVMCGSDGKAQVLTVLHNPSRNKAEGERVIQAGGVLYHDRVGHPVIHPSFLSIAVSRAIGDRGFKASSFTQDRVSGIIAEPHVMHVKLEPNEHRFVIIACDGVWDVITYQDAVDFVQGKINEGLKAEIIVHELVAKAAKTSMDNITCVLLVFDWTDKSNTSESI